MEKKEECGFDIMIAYVRKSDVGRGGGGSGGGGGGEEDGTISFLPTILAMHSLCY